MRSIVLVLALSLSGCGSSAGPIAECMVQFGLPYPCSDVAKQAKLNALDALVSAAIDYRLPDVEMQSQDAYKTLYDANAADRPYACALADWKIAQGLCTFSLHGITQDVEPDLYKICRDARAMPRG